MASGLARAQRPDTRSLYSTPEAGLEWLKNG